MDIYFFQPERYERMYNCNMYNVDQIPLEQRQHVGLGLTWMGLTTIFQVLYLPCIFSLSKHLENPCYALMFYIGIVDMVTLVCNGWLTGYFGIIGMMFCVSPKFNYFLSCYGLSCWFAESMAQIILAFNRCLELWSSELAALLFSGKKIFFWMVLPTAYGLGFGLFSRAFAFNSVYFSWFSYPHAGYLDAADISEYMNVAHSIHNHMVLVALVGIYLLFCVLLLVKARGTGHSDSGPSFSQKKIFLQVMVISGVNAIAASVFVYMQYFQLSPFIILLGTFCWLCAHGLPPIIYLLMNKTIRKDCQGMLLALLGKDLNATSTVYPSGELSRKNALGADATEG